MSIESVLHEDRSFAPSDSFVAGARIKSMDEYQKLYRKSLDQPEEFWREVTDSFHWMKDWNQLVEFDAKEPTAKWFIGGKTNITYNCIDRHLDKHAGKVAYYFEGEKGDSSEITYLELHKKVGQAANALKAMGVQKGDRVAIYMPMMVEAVIAMHACARIGAVHSVVFGGFSANALADRINDAEARVVITADGAFRRGAVVPLKSCVDEAVSKCPSVSRVLVVKRTGNIYTVNFFV